MKEDMIDAEPARLQVAAILEDYRKYSGELVEILNGKYKGRKAVIKGVMMDNMDGVRFCCYVLRQDGEGVLNSDAESRWYRPSSHFRLLGERAAKTYINSGIDVT